MVAAIWNFHTTAMEWEKTMIKPEIEVSLYTSASTVASESTSDLFINKTFTNDAGTVDYTDLFK